MLSRVADSIYWMNRYIERAENYARFMDVNFNLSLDMPEDLSAQWGPVVTTTGDWDLFVKLHKEPERDKVIYFLTFDSQNPNSIYNCILSARENARSIRTEITKEVWEQINSLYFLVKEGQDQKLWKKRDPRKFFSDIKKGCHLLYGIFDTTISRTEAWHFGKIGQMLERADKTSRVLDVKYHILLPSPEQVGTPLDLIQWAALLKSCSAYDMYRKKYGKLSTHYISEFLILDKDFPRAIYRCLSQAELSLKALSVQSEGYSNNAEKQLGKLKSQLDFVDISEIFQKGMHEFLDEIQLNLNTVSTAIYETFISTENLLDKE